MTEYVVVGGDEFIRVMQNMKPGDTVVFDEVK